MEIQPVLILRNTDIHRFIELLWDTTKLSTNSANGVSKIYEDRVYALSNVIYMKIRVLQGKWFNLSRSYQDIQLLKCI